MQEPSLSLSDLSQCCWDRKSKEFRIPVSVSVWPQRCCNQKILTERRSPVSVCLSVSDLSRFWDQNPRRLSPTSPMSLSLYLSLHLFCSFSTSDFGRCRGQKILQGWWSQALSGSRKKINFIGHNFLTLSEILLRVFSVWKMFDQKLHRHRVK